MKRFLLMAATLSCLFFFIDRVDSAFVVLTADNQAIYDYAHVLKSEKLTELQTILQHVEKQTGVEMAVVTVPSLNDQRVSESAPFVLDLFNKWGIGHKPANTGVMVLMAMKERTVRFEFGSDFTPDDISLISEKFKNSVLPLLAQKNYSDGIFAASMLAIQAAIEDVSFWWYHRISFILFGLSLISLGGLYWSKKYQVKEGIIMGVLVFATLFIMALVKYNPDNSKPGFGGGKTDGVGVTERWMVS